MTIPGVLKKALLECAEKPDDQQAVYKAESAYWSWLTDSIADLVRSREDHAGFFDEHRDLIDFGLAAELVPNVEAVRTEIRSGTGERGFLHILSFTEYLGETIRGITEGSRRQFVEKDIATTNLHTDRTIKEMAELQKARRLDVMQGLASAGAVAASAQAEAMDHLDELLMHSLETKKAIAQGVFVSVEKKREHAQREQHIALELDRIEKSLHGITDNELSQRIRQQSKQVTETIARVVDLRDSAAKLEKQLRKIEEEQSSISPLEVENRTREEITYLRDLVKLSARRLHITSSPVIRPKDAYFTVKQLNGCLDRVIEFDPTLFRNDRVTLFGKPSILLVPGNGNALYDWKHNQIVVPVVPYQKNALVSLVSGIIEYRLDVDEDKRLIYSYNELPDNKKTKSLILLKSKLTKDYIAWMTSEYSGFRVLPAPVRKWFLHEIAPNRSEIFTPPEYQSFALSAAEFKQRLDALEPTLEDPVKATETNLWVGSILYYQQGKYKRAFDLLKALVQRNPAFPFAYFNLGQIGMKIMAKQEAIDAFTKFSSLNQQNWWTGLAHELVKQLQLG